MSCSLFQFRRIHIVIVVQLAAVFFVLDYASAIFCLTGVVVAASKGMQALERAITLTE